MPRRLPLTIVDRPEDWKRGGAKVDDLDILAFIKTRLHF